MNIIVALLSKTVLYHVWKRKLPASGDPNFIDVTNQTFLLHATPAQTYCQDEESQLSEALVTMCTQGIGHFAIDMNFC